MKQEIVILEPKYDQAIALAKYLKKSGNFKVIGCIDKINNSFTNKFYSHKYYDEIIEHEINKLLLDKYSIVVPTGASSTLCYSKIADFCKIGDVIFKKENLIVSDKLYMLNLCQQLKVPIPKMYNLDDKIKQFPLFCKSKYEISEYKKIKKVLKTKSDIDNLPHKEVIIQEYIQSSSTFGMGFIAKEGKIITSFMHEELISYPKQGGAGVLLKIFENKEIYQHTATLLHALNYTGWGLSEFKYDSLRNEYVFMEINGKFWASLEFALLCNPQFGKLLFGIDYPAKPKKYFVYLNRLMTTYSWKVFKYLPQIVAAYKSKSGSCRKMLVEFLNHWAGVFL
ncbi:MAG: hypothetical protein FWH18_06505 [Marinilabiliaceae bacterium]|nr:hypothetical protein [Marinilabiliaceae bacterium]